METIGDAEAVPVATVARTLSVHHSTVFRMLSDGRLDRVKVGRATRVTVASLRAFIAPAFPTTAREPQ